MEVFNDNINTHIEIFKIINKIKKKYQLARYISIVFNEDIKFVDPFFLILLLQYRKHKNKFLILDTYNCTNKVEAYLINFLTQQIQFIEVKSPSTLPIGGVPVVKREENYQTNFDIPRKDSPSTYLYSKKDIDEINLQYSFCKDNYQFLPILSLTNETKNTIEYNEHIFEDKIKKDCRDFYKNISIDYYKTNNTYEKNLYSAIHQVLEAIEKPKYKQAFEKKDFFEEDYNDNLKLLNKDLANIFFELVDNIKRHTKIGKTYSNAYISSRYNDGFKRYEFIISDDYELGFIKSFNKTLEDNLLKLPPDLLKNDENIEKKYKVAFDKISTKKENTDIDILDGLFGIKDTFGIREIQRLTMHFGIPMLMNLLKKLQGIFDIYVHHEDRYYHISFDGTKDDSPKVTALKEENIFYGVRGTHIYISFPKNGLLKYLQEKIIQPTKHKLNIENQTFKNIFKQKIQIQKQVDAFNYIKVQNLEKELFSSNEYSQIILEYTENEQGDNYFKGSISDFFRALFAYALFHNTQNIYIYNFPIDIYKGYIAVIVERIYKGSTDNNIKLPNIIFQNKDSFDIAFIGGDSLEELVSINEHISMAYHDNKTSIFKSISVDYVEPKIYDNSKLFFKLGEEYILLPFVLFKNKYIKMSILGSIMREYLERDPLDIHVDTKKGYHINKLFQFSNLFSDSQWVNRIAFVLASYGDENTVFIGTDKYTSLIIAIANSFCANDNYFIIDNMQNNQDLINTFIRENQNKEIIVLSTVNFSFQDKNKYIINNLVTSKISHQNIAVVKIHTADVYSNCTVSSITDLYLVEKKDYYKVNDSSTCEICITPSEEKPLYELDESNVFAVKNFYKDKYTLKPKSILSKKINSVKWHNSIHFVHAKRGNNHYTFYTKTINFFKQNELEIKHFFTKTINSNISKIVNNRKVIIFAPRHNTNNNFITYVDKYLFNNDATIYRFEKDYGEKNFYDLGFIDNDISDSKKTAIFFVDDEISSGYTMEYFYTLLRVKGAERKFDASITMIDRVNINDIKVICNYVEGDSFNAKVNRLYSFTKLEIKPIKAGIENCFLCDKQKEYGQLLTTSTLDMNRFQIAERIVKLNTTDAYSIDENMQYDNLKTELKTYLKMYAVDFVYREFEAFHTMAEKYIANNTKTNIKALHKKYMILENELYEEVKIYLKIYFLKIGTFSLLIDSVFERICKYEINIALLKAISFPKLAYFHDIRNIATKIIICRLRSKIREKGNRKYHYCSKEEGLDSKKIQKEIIQTMFNEVEKKDLFNQPLTEELQEFFKAYEDKNNLNYINFLYITAAYLDIHAILDLENIQFYYHISHDVKKNNYEHKLLHIYPTAIKLLTEKYIDKSRYFDQQLLQFYCKELTDIKRKEHCHQIYGKTFSLVNALFLENIKIYSENLPKIEDLAAEKKLNKLIENIEEFCKNKFKQYKSLEKQKNTCDGNPKAYTIDSNNFKVEKIYINEHIERSYTNYSEYLKHSALRDLTHDMKKLDINDEIYPLYTGAVSGTKCSNDFEPMYNITDSNEEKEKSIKKSIDCTWSNGWIEYEINQKIKYCTIIRLVDVNYQKLKDIYETSDIKGNSNLWYKPIGLIVVSHDGDYSTHLVYSRLLLSLQKYIVDFFKQEFDYGRFQESIETKYTLHYQKIKEELKLSQKEMEVNSEKKSKEKVLDILSKISHSYGRFIGIGKSLDKLYSFTIDNSRVYSDFNILNLVKNYTNGLQYIFQTGKLDESSGLKRAKVSSFLDDEFEEEVKNFLTSAPLFFANDVDYKIENRIKIKHDFKLNIINDFEIAIGNSIENFKTIIFELIFNAIKKNADKSIEILISVNYDTIIIANTGEPIDDPLTLFDEGGDGSGAGIGLFRIYKYLSSIEIDISTSKFPNYDAVFKIKERV